MKTVLDIVHNLPSAHTNPAIVALEKILEDRRHRVGMIHQNIDEHRRAITILEAEAAHMMLDVADLELALERIEAK